MHFGFVHISFDLIIIFEVILLICAICIPVSGSNINESVNEKRPPSTDSG